MAKLAIVEDNLLLRQNLLKRLSGFPEVEVTLTCTNGKQFLDALRALGPESFPQVVLMDVEMDVMNGIQATAEAKSQYPDLHIIMLSVFDDDERVFDAIRAGASGYMLKEESVPSLVKAIKDVLDGKVSMSPAIARKTLEYVRNTPHPAASRKVKSNSPTLSKRELQILEMLSKGHTYQSISSTLFLSEYTVQTHIKNIYAKLQVKNKISAIRIALEKKWF